jgi:hypothetical protein
MWGGYNDVGYPKALVQTNNSSSRALMQPQLDKQDATECGEAKAKPKQSMLVKELCLRSPQNIAVEKARKDFTGSLLVWKHTKKPHLISYALVCMTAAK